MFGSAEVEREPEFAGMTAKGTGTDAMRARAANARVRTRAVNTPASLPIAPSATNGGPMCRK